MSVLPYLRFPGTCEAAMTFYASVFGTEIDMMMKATEMPDFTAPTGMENQIAHASMKFAGGEIYASDAFEPGAGTMAGCSIMVTMPDTGAGKATFEKLAEGGQVQMPYQATFWSPGFGTLIDQFGVHWMVSTDEQSDGA